MADSVKKEADDDTEKNTFAHPYRHRQMLSKSEADIMMRSTQSDHSTNSTFETILCESNCRESGLEDRKWCREGRKEEYEAASVTVTERNDDLELH